MRNPCCGLYCTTMHACLPSTVVPFTLELASDLYLPRLQDVSVLVHALNKQSVVSVSQSVSESV